MKKSRFSEEQIIAVLREQDSGMETADVCCKHGISSATLIAIQGFVLLKGWLAAKPTIVVILSGLHGVQAGRIGRFVGDRAAVAHYSQTFAPAAVILMVAAIAILAVTKPF